MSLIWMLSDTRQGQEEDNLITLSFLDKAAETGDSSVLRAPPAPCSSTGTSGLSQEPLPPQAILLRPHLSSGLNHSLFPSTPPPPGTDMGMSALIPGPLLRLAGLPTWLRHHPTSAELT
ncbi:hypothetical protein CB1_000932025 [Camelus ferus]|nr:hypothetical protein CB1_000932025 [Camelus ferus]